MSSCASRSLLRAIGQVQVIGPSLDHSVTGISANYCLSRKLHLFQLGNTWTQLSRTTSYKHWSFARFLHGDRPVGSVEDRSPEPNTEQEDTSEKSEQSEQVQIPEAVSTNSVNRFHYSIPKRRQFGSRQSFASSLEKDANIEECNNHIMQEESPLQDFTVALRKCTSPSDVLHLTTRYSLSTKQHSNCLTTMWDSTKKMSEEKRRYERTLMFEHPAFAQLCLRVSQEASRMAPDDLVYSLHALLKLKVSQRARVIETLFRHCQERLNELNEKAMSVLASSLEGLENTKNVEALRYGLRLRVEQRIPRIKSPLALQTMMRCIGKDAPTSLKEKLESKALQLFDQFSLPNCQHMYTTLASMGFSSLPLLDACSNRIIGNINGIPFWRFVHILQSCKDLQYENVDLFYAVGDYVAGTMYMWQIKQIVLFLSLFENLGFRHEGLMDAFAEKVIARPESLILKDLVISLRVYSMLNHFPGGQNPQFLYALNTILELYLSRIPAVELLRVVYSFCIMGYFPQTPLDQLLQEDTLNELLNSASQNITMNERMLHYVNLCLELDKSSVTKPAATVVLETPSSGLLTTTTSLRLAMQDILGDEDYFHHKVQFTNDYYIDFEICMDEDRRKVIPLTEKDDVGNTASVQRVAVLCAPPSSFCLGTDHPKGKLAMKMRHLRAMGYHVVLVHEQEFEEMKMEERNVFLKSHIFAQDTVQIPDLKPSEQHLEL